MKDKYCFWSVVDGPYAVMAQVLINSARRVGVFKDFHVWTDTPIEGAVCHELGTLDKQGCLFKLKYLAECVRTLKYEYFVWLDTDAFFVRNPGNLLSVLKGSPVHVSLESDLFCPRNKRLQWWGCPNDQIAQMMRANGVRSNSIFNVNGGFFIVHRDVVHTFYTLCHQFWLYGQSQGFTFNDEPLLAYAMQMLCGNPYVHTLRETSEFWASDWHGHFANRLPDDQPWWFVDYFTGERIPVNPAIVHAMRSKNALISAGIPKV